MSFIVLSAGRDPVVLRNRNAALEQAGYTVASANNSPEVVDRLFNGEFDVVLLCHSIPEEERRRLAEIIRNYSSATPVIVISDFDGRQYSYGTRTARCFPDQIIAAIRETLTPEGPWKAAAPVNQRVRRPA